MPETAGMAASSEIKAPTATPEPSPEASQFDFWLGEWDCTWGDGERGSNSVQAIMGGFVVLEQFNGEPAMPLHGMSVSVYTPALKQWRQTWVDDEGNYLDFAGEFQDGRMVLARTAVEEGEHVRQRMVWYNIVPDSLDWDWQRSEDAGASWQSLWTIHYRRK
jgi:hypothetical protein